MNQFPMFAGWWFFKAASAYSFLTRACQSLGLQKMLQTSSSWLHATHMILIFMHAHKWWYVPHAVIHNSEANAVYIEIWVMRHTLKRSWAIFLVSVSLQARGAEGTCGIVSEFPQRHPSLRPGRDQQRDRVSAWRFKKSTGLHGLTCRYLYDW